MSVNELKQRRDTLRAEIESASSHATKVIEAKMALLTLAIIRLEALEAAQAAYDDTIKEVERYV